MQGRIEDVDLYALVELLTLKPGRSELRIRRSGLADGVLCFAAGELIEAKAGRLSGDEALFEVLSWKEGRFQVIEMPEPSSGER